MKEKLDKLEDEIKAIEDNELRLAFTAEQASHSYTNMFVENYRSWGVPYPQELGRFTAAISFLTPIPIMYFLVLMNKYDRVLS